MRALRLAICVVVLMMPSAKATAQDTTSPSTAILAVLNHSADDWNRGDLDAFAAGYKDSPDILFIGKTISRGYAQMLAHYKASYPTKAKMGTLSFRQLEVQPLDERFATVTGWYHLDREQAAGGVADGYFLLVVEKTAAGWKIIRDDTTGVTAKP